MTKKIDTPTEPSNEVTPENPKTGTENKDYIKKLDLQRLVLKKLMDRKLEQTTPSEDIDELYCDEPESKTDKYFNLRLEKPENPNKTKK